jgi:tellurite resistance protein
MWCCSQGFAICPFDKTITNEEKRNNNMRVNVSFECEVEKSETINDIINAIAEQFPYGKCCTYDIKGCIVMNREVSNPSLRNMIESDVQDIEAFEYWEDMLKEHEPSDEVLEAAIVALSNDEGVRDAFEMMVTDKSHMVIPLSNDERIFKHGDKEYRIVERKKEE